MAIEHEEIKTLHSNHVSNSLTECDTYLSVIPDLSEELYHFHNLVRIAENLTLYQDSSLHSDNSLEIHYKSGNKFEFNWARDLNDDPGYFKELGFTNFAQFYELDKKFRNRFLIQAISLLNNLFPEGINENIIDSAFLKKVLHFYHEITILAQKFKGKG